MKQEVWQYNMCPMNIITASASSYFVYVEVKVGTHTIFHLMKASKTQEVKLEFHMTLVQSYGYFTWSGETSFYR